LQLPLVALFPSSHLSVAPSFATTSPCTPALGSSLRTNRTPTPHIRVLYEPHTRNLAVVLQPAQPSSDPAATLPHALDAVASRRLHRRPTALCCTSIKAGRPYGSKCLSAGSVSPSTCGLSLPRCAAPTGTFLGEPCRTTRESRGHFAPACFPSSFLLRFKITIKKCKANRLAGRHTYTSIPPI